MNTKHVLEAQDVETILAAGRLEADKHGWKVSITVVDDGGHPLGLVRIDGASPLTAYMSTEKARTSALSRRESKVFEDMINGGRTAFLSAPLTATLEGGVPIVMNAACIGAVGVSGVKSEEDAQVAKAAIAHLAANNA